MKTNTEEDNYGKSLSARDKGTLQDPGARS